MVNEETSQEPVEPKTMAGKFLNSPILARRTFIIGIAAFSLFLIFVSIFTIIQRGIIYDLVLYSLFFVLAFSGIIVGGISFRDGKNVFGIIGFILNIISVALLAGTLFQIINLLTKYPF